MFLHMQKSSYAMLEPQSEKSNNDSQFVGRHNQNRPERSCMSQKDLFDFVLTETIKIPSTLAIVCGLPSCSKSKTLECLFKKHVTVIPGHEEEFTPEMSKHFSFQELIVINNEE